MMRFLLVFVLSIASLGVEQQQPYAPKQSDRPEAVAGDEPGFQSDLRRQDARRLGRRPDVLAGRERGRSSAKSRRRP